MKTTIFMNHLANNQVSKSFRAGCTPSGALCKARSTSFTAGETATLQCKPNLVLQKTIMLIHLAHKETMYKQANFHSRVGRPKGTSNCCEKNTLVKVLDSRSVALEMMIRGVGPHQSSQELHYIQKD